MWRISSLQSLLITNFFLKNQKLLSSEKSTAKILPISLRTDYLIFCVELISSDKETYGGGGVTEMRRTVAGEKMIWMESRKGLC